MTDHATRTDPRTQVPRNDATDVLKRMAMLLDIEKVPVSANMNIKVPWWRTYVSYVQGRAFTDKMLGDWAHVLDRRRLRIQQLLGPGPCDIADKHERLLLRTAQQALTLGYRCIGDFAAALSDVNLEPPELGFLHIVGEEGTEKPNKLGFTTRNGTKRLEEYGRGQPVDLVRRYLFELGLRESIILDRMLKDALIQHRIEAGRSTEHYNLTAKELANAVLECAKQQGFVIFHWCSLRLDHYEHGQML